MNSFKNWLKKEIIKTLENLVKGVDGWKPVKVIIDGEK